MPMMLALHDKRRGEAEPCNSDITQIQHDTQKRLKNLSKVTLVTYIILKFMFFFKEGRRS